MYTENPICLSWTLNFNTFHHYKFVDQICGTKQDVTKVELNKLRR